MIKLFAISLLIALSKEEIAGRKAATHPQTLGARTQQWVRTLEPCVGRASVSAHKPRPSLARFADTTPSKTSKYASCEPCTTPRKKFNKAARKKLIVGGMQYVFQKGDMANTPTGNGGLVWSPPFGTNATYKDAIAPYDLESNNKFDEKISAYKVKTPMMKQHLRGTYSTQSVAEIGSWWDCRTEELG